MHGIRMIARVGLLLATALVAWPVTQAAAQAEAQVAAMPAPPELPSDTAFSRFRWYGEELIYSVQILGREAARAGLAVGFPEDHPDWGWIIPLDGVATSVGLMSGFYAINDVARTWVEPGSGLPRYSTKDLDERGRQRAYAVTYEQPSYRADVVRIRNEGEQRYFRHAPSDLHDAMSWIYDLRSRDLSVGQEYIYYIYDGWKMSRLTVRVGRHRPIFTGLGTLDAAWLQFVREVLTSGIATPWANDVAMTPPVYLVSEGPIALGQGWISLDDRRLPLGVEIDTPLGPIRVMVQEHVPPDPTFRPDPALGAVRR